MTATRPPDASKAGRCDLHLRLDLRVDEARARDDDHADATGDEGAQLSDLVERVTAGVADLHDPAVLGGDLEDPAGYLGEIGVADLMHNEPHAGAGPARE